MTLGSVPGINTKYQPALNALYGRQGDTIVAFRPLYFRCSGRDRWHTPLRYAWDEFQTLNLVRV